MSLPRQGEIWWAETEHKRRPVLVVTRSEAVGVLTGIVAAPVSRTVRAIPTEIPWTGTRACRASARPPSTTSSGYGGRRSPSGWALRPRRKEICVALRALADC